MKSHIFYLRIWWWFSWFKFYYNLFHLPDNDYPQNLVSRGILALPGSLGCAGLQVCWSSHQIVCTMEVVDSTWNSRAVDWFESPSSNILSCHLVPSYLCSTLLEQEALYRGIVSFFEYLHSKQQEVEETTTQHGVKQKESLLWPVYVWETASYCRKIL